MSVPAPPAVKFTALTRAGVGKSNGEDYLLFNETVLHEKDIAITLDSKDFIVAVADGVGGSTNGGEAARLVLRAIADQWQDLEVDVRVVEDFLIKINRQLLSLSAKTHSDMATTVTGLLRRDCDIVLFHVGNTRLYGKFGDYLNQWTDDHTTVEELRRRGMFEAAEKANRSEITACFGGGNEGFLWRLVVQKIEALPPMLVLTSDGIHEFVHIETMESLLFEEGDDLEKLNQIATMAIANGSKDDLSMALLEF